MSDFAPMFGFQDFTAASQEAERLSTEAYNAGDMAAADQWSSVSWDSWNAGTDLQIAGADAYGTMSPGTSEGYFPEATDYSATPTEGTDFTSWYDTMSYDSSISAVEPYAGTDMSSGMAGGSMPDYTSTVDNTASDNTMSYYTSSE